MNLRKVMKQIQCIKCDLVVDSTCKNKKKVRSKYGPCEIFSEIGADLENL